MIFSVNASAHKILSGTAINVLDAQLVSFMQVEVAIAQMELSSMELNVQSELLINVSVFQTPIGMELIVSASQVSLPVVTLATATVLSSVIIVKDVLLNPTLSGPTESANVTMVM